MKKYYLGLTVAFAALVLAACGEASTSLPSSSDSVTTSVAPSSSTAPSSSSTTTSSSTDSSSTTPSSSVVTLSTITINNANDTTIDFDTPFNVFTGVTAIGNNGVDYTSSITLNTTSTAINTTTGVLDTTKTGLHAVRYNVTISGITSQKWRNITVSQPVSTGLLVNGDFSLGTAGWDNPSVVYIADGAAMTLSTVAGEFKVEVTAGFNFFTPRFGQMNIPFELGKTYEVAFDARSSVTKEIALQVGELLPAPPWFTDFLPNVENILYRTITTSMSRYSYQFTMTQNNPRGGILFGLGRVNNASINATMYFDNITVAETTLGDDTSAPIFAGVLPQVNVLVGATYDPLAGVSAIDVVDGDVTDAIVVEILDSNDTVVNAVDTTTPGVFTVNYSVEDAASNEATAQTIVNVVDLVFRNENLLVNGSFTDTVGAEWGYYQTTDADTWAPGVKPVVVQSQDTVAGTYSLDITGGGHAVWAIQLYQENVNLVEGTTYRFSVTGSSTVARNISVGIGYGDPWNEYGRKNGIELSTSSSTQDFVFTVTKATADVKVVLELGEQTGFADSVITLEEVRLQRLDATPLVANSDFSLSGWRGFGEGSGNVFTAGVVNGEFVMTVTAQNASANWNLQIVQDAESLAGIPGVSQFLDVDLNKTYTLSFDAYATEAVTITPNLFGVDIWYNFVQSPATVLTTEKQTFTKTVSITGAALNNTEKLAFEFGTGFTLGANPVSVYLDNVSIKEGATALPTLYNGDMETVLGGHATIGNATFVNTNEGALMTVNGMGAAWEPHYFYIFSSLEKGDYEVKFVVKGDVSRTIRFNIVLPDAGFSSILPDDYEDFNIVANQTYVFTFSFSVTTPLTNVKVEFDFGNLGAGSTSVLGAFLISELLVYRNYNA